MPKHEVPAARYNEVVRFLHDAPADSWSAAATAHHIIDVLGLVVAPELPEPGGLVVEVEMVHRLPTGTLLCHRNESSGRRTYLEIARDTQEGLYLMVMDFEEREYSIKPYLPARLVEYPD